MKPQDRDEGARWRRRKEARPAEILDAALACFTEHGFAATRLDEVAQRAGVTKGTLYLYFDSKEDLFKAVVRRTIIPNIEKIEAIVYDATAPASVLLERLIECWREIILSPASAIPKLMVAEAGNFPDLARFYLDEVVHRGMAPVRRVLCAGIDRGEFRAVDVESAVLCVLAPLLFAMLWRHSLGRQDPGIPVPAALCAAHFDLLLGGLLDHSAGAAAEPSAVIHQEGTALREQEGRAP